MNEIIFLVENAVEGGYTARALGESIFTEGYNLEELRSNIRDAVDCHLGQSPTATNIKLAYRSNILPAAKAKSLSFFVKADYTSVMPLTIDQITAEAMHLPLSSRAELAEKLVGSLDFSDDGDIQQAWASEAIRRRDDVRSGKVKTIPGEEVLAEVRQMLER